MLEKIKVLKNLNINEFGFIHVQYAWRVLEDGNFLSETYERVVYHIKDDLRDKEDKIKSLSALKNSYPDKPVPVITPRTIEG